MSDTEQQRMAAFRQMADERLDWCYRLATAILGDSSRSQDAVHDAVVLAWERWLSLRDHAKFDAWFDRIVVNVCREHLRRTARHPITDISTLVAMTTPDPALDVERRVLVGHAFDRLKPDDVVVLALRHFLDLQLADIALLLDIPLQTANSRLRTARSRLRSHLEELPTDKVSR